MASLWQRRWEGLQASVDKIIKQCLRYHAGRTYWYWNPDPHTESIRYADSVEWLDHRTSNGSLSHSPEKIYDRIPNKDDYQVATKWPTVPQSLQTSEHRKAKEQALKNHQRYPEQIECWSGLRRKAEHSTEWQIYCHRYFGTGFSE